MPDKEKDFQRIDDLAVLSEGDEILVIHKRPDESKELNYSRYGKFKAIKHYGWLFMQEYITLPIALDCDSNDTTNILGFLKELKETNYKWKQGSGEDPCPLQVGNGSYVTSYWQVYVVQEFIV